MFQVASKESISHNGVVDWSVTVGEHGLTFLRVFISQWLYQVTFQIIQA